MQPLVSVVIPCYGQAHFVGDAIDSVFRQSCPALELIVVNDGAPDTELLEQVIARSPGPIDYVRQQNRGLAAARNAGLARCRGEFVVFLDADDRLLPNAIGEGAAALAVRPNCGLVWGLRDIIDAAGSVRRPGIGMAETGERYVDLLQTNIVGPPVGVMWRTAAVRAVGGFASGIDVEDYDAYLRVAREYEIHCHGATVGEYRVHGKNMSLDHERMLVGFQAALDRQLDWIGDDMEMQRALELGRRDAMEEYVWSPGLDRVRALAKEGQWLRASVAAARLFRRYPLRTAPALLRGARKIVPVLRESVGEVRPSAAGVTGELGDHGAVDVRHLATEPDGDRRGEIED